MSPFAQSRNDTLGWRTHLARNGIISKRWVRPAGSRAETGHAGARSAALEAVVVTQHHGKAVRQSVAAISAWRFDRGEHLEIQIDDGLKGFRCRRFPQRLWQGIEPRGAIGLDVDQFPRGIAPTLDAASAVNRPVRADHDGWRWSRMFRPPPRLSLGVAGVGSGYV
jgi:hypothetical protein